ncbi:MAG TPA: FecR family protein [Ferruginibacter sp.]|nr:FecR family protein [Ferruginibacter sp.]HMP19988.1 FecR family protein [Ferruginibacter sp.]
MDKKHSEDEIWILMARKLAGEATSSELEELAALLRENPELNYAKEIMQDVWNSQVLPDRQYAETKYKELVLQMQEMKIDEGRFSEDNHFINNEEEVKRNWWNRNKIWLSAAAIVIVVSAATLWFINGSNKTNGALAALPLKNEVSTKNGSKTNLVLPDGTKVWLNAGSRLTYDKNYGNNIRQVQLEGEGFFDVVHNTEKPFIIQTATIDVKVLGTQFNVKCYPADKTTETSLIRGSVEVNVKSRGEKFLLRPNEKLIVYNNNSKDSKTNTAETVQDKAEAPLVAIRQLSYQRNDNEAVEAAWVKNQLSFKDESFGEVAKKMERWYNVEFVFINKARESMQVYGTFNNESLQQALQALEFSFGFKYKIEGSKVVIF